MSEYRRRCLPGSDKTVLVNELIEDTRLEASETAITPTVALGLVLDALSTLPPPNNGSEERQPRQHESSRSIRKA